MVADESVDAVAIVHVPNADGRVQRPAHDVLTVKLQTVNAIGVTLWAERGRNVGKMGGGRDVVGTWRE